MQDAAANEPAATEPAAPTEPVATEPQVGEKRPLDEESSAVTEPQADPTWRDDVRGCSSRVLAPAAPMNIQVESINQAIAQHQAVIQTQSDIAQVLGTVSTSLTALVSGLDSGYPADRQTVQAVVSQVETLRAIQNTSVQSLHTSCATLQNILAHATPSQQAGAPAEAAPPAPTPMLQPPPMLAPPMLQPQVQMQPQPVQMQPQMMYQPQPVPMMYQPQPMQPQPQMMYQPQPQAQPQAQAQPDQTTYAAGGPGDAIADAVFGAIAGGGPVATVTTQQLQPVALPAAMSYQDDRKKTSLCKNFPMGTCTYGDRCHLAHQPSPSPSPSPSP